MTSESLFRNLIALLLAVLTLCSGGSVCAGDINGAVTEQGTGAPIANIDIDVFDSNLVSVATNARSDDLGAYEVTGLPAGQYIIRADPSVTDGYVDQYNGGVFLKSQASFLTVPGVGAVTVNFELSLGAPISGRITIQDLGTAVSGVDIDVFTQSGTLVDSVNATTDGSGDYSIGVFPPGNYLLRADPTAASFLVERFYLNGDSRLTATPISVSGPTPISDINIQVLRGGLIRGLVKDAGTLEPVSGVDLDVFDSLGTFQNANAATVASGTYELGPMPPGQYFVRADPLPASNYVATYHPNSLQQFSATLVTVSVNMVTSGIDVAVPRGGTISGLVRDSETLLPLADIDLDVFDLLGVRMPVNAKTDSAGNYLIGVLPAGHYRVRADPTLGQGFASEYFNEVILEASGALVTVTTNSNTPNISFDLDRAAVIEGVITGADTLLPLAGIDLDLFTEQGNLYASANAISSATGFFRLGPVPPGAWVLQADPTIAQGYVDEYYDSELAFSRATRIFCNAGQTRPNTNLVLDRGGLITGTIRLQSNNQPYAHCDLDVFFTDRRRVDDAAISDTNGNYILGLLPPGQYIVRADPPTVSELAEEYYTNVLDITSALPVTVDLGQTTGMIDFSLDPPPGPTSTPTPTSTGTVTPSLTPTPTSSLLPTATPTGPDSTPTETATPSNTRDSLLPTDTPDGDINSDTFINVVDLLLLLEQWKNNAPDPARSADFDADATVGPQDLRFLMLRWKTETLP